MNAKSWARLVTLALCAQMLSAAGLAAESANARLAGTALSGGPRRHSVPDDAQSKSSPHRPPSLRAQEAPAVLDSQKLIDGVPAYNWYNGCGPTAVAMVLGYWDTHGYPQMLPGDASTQTDEVNAAISSGGNYTDYCYPEDYPEEDPSPLPDKSEPPFGDEHPNDCIADFMYTSQSYEDNYYGWSWFSDVPGAFEGWLALVAPHYKVTTTEAYWASLTWSQYCAEIDANRPVVLLVDTDGNGDSDHFVTAIGYGVSGVTNYYACYDTQGSGISWQPFRGIAAGQAWGIYGATFFEMSGEGRYYDHLFSSSSQEINGVWRPNPTLTLSFAEDGQTVVLDNCTGTPAPDTLDCNWTLSASDFHCVAQGNWHAAGGTESAGSHRDLASSLNSKSVMVKSASFGAWDADVMDKLRVGSNTSSTYLRPVHHSACDSEWSIDGPTDTSLDLTKAAWGDYLYISPSDLSAIKGGWIDGEIVAVVDQVITGGDVHLWVGNSTDGLGSKQKNTQSIHGGDVGSVCSWTLSSSEIGEHNYFQLKGDNDDNTHIKIKNIWFLVRYHWNALGVPKSEYDALVALYNSTGGDNWSHRDNWLSDSTPWYGVSVESGHVTALNLTSNQLTGPIPPQLGNLTGLQYLWLGSNHLTGSIPPELGDLANLEWLLLYDNQLTGSIPPELGNLANLTSLCVDGNRLSGSIPPELGNLADLEDLFVDGNQLTGSIPPELGNLANLWWLNLSENLLTGSIPPQLGNLASLRYLYLDYNQLTGAIPPGLGNLANLRYLCLDYNQLTGSIPPELGNLANLWWLDLSENLLTGSIPPQLGNLACLQELGLGCNQLTGSIPPQLGNLANLEDLFLDGNQLTGSIPPELGNLVNVYYLNLSYNGLSASYPALIAFLDSKAPGWQNTQTVPPSDVSAGIVGPGTAAVSWTPILYTADGGYYEVGASAVQGGPYVFLPENRTSGKSATYLTATGLPGQYLVVRTVTPPHASNRSTVTSLPCAEVAAVVSGLNKLLADGSATDVRDAVVTALFPGFFYMENDNRSSGIRAVSGQSPALGRVNVVGTMRTNDEGERYIEASSVSAAGSGSLQPLGLTDRALGGGGWLYEPASGAGQRGVKNGAGLNNIGLLVRVSGRIVDREQVAPPLLPSWFKMDDGSGANVKCVVPSGVTIDPGWQFVGVTGISSCERVDGDLYPVLRVLTQDDVTPY